MRNFDEPLAWLAAHALSRRVRLDVIRMLGLQLLQRVHQAVEFRVADLRIVEHVIAVLVMPNLFAQGFDFVLDVVLDGFHLKTISPRRHGGTENESE